MVTKLEIADKHFWIVQIFEVLVVYHKFYGGIVLFPKILIKGERNCNGLTYQALLALCCWS